MWRSVSSSSIGFLLLATQLWAATQGRGRFPDPNESSDPSLAMQSRVQRESSFASTSEEKGARDLVKSWCSAYGQSDPERLAALETTEVEIVDRFGDWHHLTGLKDRERFWREGFDMIRKKNFHPGCIIEHVRLIRFDVVIVQVKVFYDQGIRLMGSDRIPPFSEIHTFVLMKGDRAWLISVQDIVQRISLK